jgi:hypothetical protein
MSNKRKWSPDDGTPREEIDPNYLRTSQKHRGEKLPKTPASHELQRKKFHPLLSILVLGLGVVGAFALAIHMVKRISANTAQVTAARVAEQTQKAQVDAPVPSIASEPDVACTHVGNAILVSAKENGQTYAINGSARSRVGSNGWQDGKVRFSSEQMLKLLNRGLAICNGVSEAAPASAGQSAAVAIHNSEAPLTPKGLIAAAYNGDLAFINRYIAAHKNLDVVVPGILKTTDYAVLSAAESGNCDVLDVLLANGAQADPKRVKVGGTPLYFAASDGYTQCVSSLLQHHVRLDVRLSPGGNTPLIEAAYMGRVGAAKLLVDAGARLDVSNGDHDTPFRAAVVFNNPEIASYIQAHGGK